MSSWSWTFATVDSRESVVWVSVHVTEASPLLDPPRILPIFFYETARIDTTLPQDLYARALGWPWSFLHAYYPVMPRFVPRQRKHKILARRSATSDARVLSPISDANAAVIFPADQAAKEERKRKLKDELRAQHTQVSAKKQKRLDKYIDNKLKKDENLEYLRLLEQEKEKNDAIKANQQGRGSVGPEKRKFDDFANGTGPVKTERRTKLAEAEDGVAESEDSFEAENPEACETSVQSPVERLSVQQGAGLAQPLVVGEDGLPLIQTKNRRKKKKRKRVLQVPINGDEEGYSSWEGFSDNQPTPSMPDGGMPLHWENAVATQEDSQSSELDDLDSEIDEVEEDSNVSDPGGDDGTPETEISSSEESFDDTGKPRVSAFGPWARAQVNKSLGHTPGYEGAPVNPSPQNQHQTTNPPIPKLTNPILGPLPVPSDPTRIPHAVYVQRSEAMQQARLELPIVHWEQEIMEAIHNHPVVIVQGATGSGKTTQIPQFLYEAGYGSLDGPTPGMIGITQPRRVAAVSMAKRVSDELGAHGQKVSYQIRFDSTVSSRTVVKFMTDGILLRELSEDLLLRKYSVIVIDEAHERSVNTDILIGLLCKIVPARLRKNQFNPDPKPLKLIIMSATLNTGDFVSDKLFPPGKKPPIVEAEGRQHRVTTHFCLRSRPDYTEEVIEKVKRAHSKLPKGGILVFLTGQNEIREVGARLRQLLGARKDPGSDVKVHAAASELPLEVEDMEIEAYKHSNGDQDDFDEVDILTHSDEEAEEDQFSVSDDDGSAQASAQKPVKSSKDTYDSVHILPLYSQLPTKQQLKVFESPPSGARLIVLATNVAETSLTIPGIRYVFDTGRSKERKYHHDSGVQSFEIDYISKDSAAQRAGRAGRTGPGHCWRLYTSAVYEQYFPEHAQPEILRAPAEHVVLQLKSFAYPKPVVDFPFPSTPRAETLQKAERLLKNLGALTPIGSITTLGKELSVYPLSPRLGKLVSRGIREAALLPHIVSLVAGLGVSELFVNESHLGLASGDRDAYEQKDDQDKKKQEYGRARATLSRLDKASDAMKLLTAVSLYNAASDSESFCRDYFLRPKAMFEVSQLQRQLTSIIKANHPTTHLAFTQQAKLSSKHVKDLNAVAASGYIDQVAIRADLSPNPPDMPFKPRRAIDVPYLPLIPLNDRPSAPLLERAVFIHPSSVIARQPYKELPVYIVYTHLQKSQAHHISTMGETSTKTRMFPLTPIDRQQLVELARDTALLEIGKPSSNTKIEDIRGTPKRRECWVGAELKGGAESGFGWPMPPQRVRQVMDVKTASGWRVEEWLS